MTTRENEKKQAEQHREEVRERVMKTFKVHHEGLKAHGHNPYESAQIGALLTLAEEVAELSDVVSMGLRYIGDMVQD